MAAREKRKLLERLRHEIDWRDWRVTWVLKSIGFSLVATGVIAIAFPSARDVSTFGGALFASWVSGLILTIVITAIVTIAQFARPHEEIFESRARNLLRRQTGAHIDYIIPKIQEFLVPYCEEGAKEMVITEYDEATRRFRINQRSVNRIKSYLNDMPVIFKTSLIYRHGTSAPEGREKSTLTYLRINGEEIGEAESFDALIERPFEINVVPHKTCEIEHRMVLWIQAEDERNRHIPTRFTRRLTVTIHNHLPTRAIEVIPNPEVYEGGPVVVKAGETVVVVDLQDKEPSKAVYDFALKLA